VSQGGPHAAGHLVGNTASDDFPVTPHAAQARHAGNADAFVVKLAPVH